MLVVTQLRKRRGWTQAELARRSRMHASQISLIESGRFRPSDSQLAKLARALRIPADQAHDLLRDVDQAALAVPIDAGSPAPRAASAR